MRYADEAVDAGAVKGGSELLNQFNSYKSLIDYARPTFGDNLKNGVLQGFIKGDADAIFKAITNIGETLPSGVVKMPDGTFIKLYESKSRSMKELFIDSPSQKYKIRIN